MLKLESEEKEKTGKNKRMIVLQNKRKGQIMKEHGNFKELI